jgi:hypothetical protein
MFLKGQHVKQSVVLGMGWLGVAIESNVAEWKGEFAKFYDAAPIELQSEIDLKVEEYIVKFGMKAQGITCVEGINKVIKRYQIKCVRGDKVSTLYPIEQVE